MNSVIFWNGIWPNWFSRSIGVYQLAHWLRSNGVECQVIDFCQWLPADKLVELSSKFITSKTKWIGISTSFLKDEKNLPPTLLSAIKILKAEYPWLKIVSGGPRAGEIKKEENLIDTVLHGEAEDSLLQLVKGHNLSPKFDITKLNHRFVHQDCIIPGEVLPIELGRGCIFKCKFCGHHNLGKAKNTYQRAMHLVEEEIAYNWDNFRTTHYNFLDDTVNEDPQKVYGLSMLPAKTGVDIKWNGYLRADLVWSKPESAEQLRRSGLKTCFFGIESLNPKSSGAIGKGWSGRHAKSFLPELYHNLWGGEISIWCNHIIGLPYETPATLIDSYNWCKDNNFGSHYFTPLTLYEGRTTVQSQFSKNYASYGYKFIGGRWHTDHLNYDTAVHYCNAFNPRMLNKPTSWLKFDLLNCGYTLDEISKFTTFNRGTHISKFKANFLAKYIVALESL